MAYYYVKVVSVISSGDTGVVGVKYTICYNCQQKAVTCFFAAVLKCMQVSESR